MKTSISDGVITIDAKSATPTEKDKILIVKINMSTFAVNMELSDE